MSAFISFALEIIGTIAFSVSGAMLGLQKKMDILGISVLGLTTAVGGGIIRDLILGINPPKTFQNPVYATVAIITALVMCTPWILRFFGRHLHLYDLLMLVMDSLGLGIFTVVGISTAYSLSDDYSVFLLIFVGVVTGVGGGVMRDTMALEPPYIYVKHFYASASILGAAACVAMWPVFGESVSMLAGTATVVVLRILAAKYRWSLPKPRLEKYFERNCKKTEMEKKRK